MDNWIPVTEKLPSFYPNKRQKVLVTMEDDNGMRFVTTAKFNETRRTWEVDNTRYLDFKVIAWQLKPSPYMGDNQKDTESLNPEKIQHEIEAFCERVKRSPYLYFETLNAAFKYGEMVRRIRPKIEDLFGFKMRDWQFEYIFFDHPIPDNVLNSRLHGLSVSNILRMCFSRGGCLEANINIASKGDLLKLGYFLGEDASSVRRAECYINEASDIYDAMKTQLPGLPLREIHFKGKR